MCILLSDRRRLPPTLVGHCRHVARESVPSTAAGERKGVFSPLLVAVAVVEPAGGCNDGVGFHGVEEAVSFLLFFFCLHLQVHRWRTKRHQALVWCSDLSSSVRSIRHIQAIQRTNRHGGGRQPASHGSGPSLLTMPKFPWKKERAFSLLG